MPRPYRRFAAIRRVVRRRHRTWMLSMTMATLGWGAWWTAVVLHVSQLGWAPGLSLTQGVSSTFAVAGILCALFTMRAKLAWVLITLVPLFANGSLILLPFFVQDLGEVVP